MNSQTIHRLGPATDYVVSVMGLITIVALHVHKIEMENLTNVSVHIKK
jgi:hypothetical protein